MIFYIHRLSTCNLPRSIHDRAWHRRSTGMDQDGRTVGQAVLSSKLACRCYGAASIRCARYGKHGAYRYLVRPELRSRRCALGDPVADNSRAENIVGQGSYPCIWRGYGGGHGYGCIRDTRCTSGVRPLHHNILTVMQRPVPLLHACLVVVPSFTMRPRLAMEEVIPRP